MKQEIKNGYQELLLETYEEFIELIRPDKQKIQEYLDCPNYELIFRGQGDSEWLLNPSLFRSKPISPALSNSYSGICFMNWVQLKAFIKGCDLNAAIVPFDSYQFRAELMREFNDKVVFDSKSWPDSRLFELIAYAQHYGVPTELLDWSRNSLVASYFAASKVVEIGDIKGNMAIWVFDTEKRNLLNSHNQVDFEIIDVPNGFNQNISSQQGCFTLIRQNISRNSIIKFDDDLKRFKEIKLLDELLCEKGIENSLLKISVPKIYAPDILKYCSAYSINAATVFRGVEGAAIYAKQSLIIEEYRQKLFDLI